MATQLRLGSGAVIDKTKALHWAATNGNESVVRLLLEEGADVEA
jgi:ankyrin repeat protein